MRSTVFAMLMCISSMCIAQERLIAVEGNGSIEVRPDIIRVTYEVGNRQKTNLAEAKRLVDETSSRSVQALLSIGINESTITSSSLNVAREEVYDETGEPDFVGHYVAREIDFVIEDITLYGAALQALIDSGVAEVGKVEPDVSDYAALKRQALAKAAENAKAEAAFLAQQFDAKLDRVHQIGKQNVRRNFLLEEVLVTAQMANSGVLPTYDFEPGNVTISSVVYVEYQLK